MKWTRLATLLSTPNGSRDLCISKPPLGSSAVAMVGVAGSSCLVRRAAHLSCPLFHPAISCPQAQSLLSGVCCHQTGGWPMLGGWPPLGCPRAPPAAARCRLQLWRHGSGNRAALRLPVEPVARAVPEAAVELAPEQQEQWAACSEVVQQRCGLEAAAAESALLKAFGWKGQGFWRQVAVQRHARHPTLMPSRLLWVVR